MLSKDIELNLRAENEVLSRKLASRVFVALEKRAALGPTVYHDPVRGRDVDVWCSNDYLGQSLNAGVKEAALRAVDLHGVGTGSVRSISGGTSDHLLLEQEVARMHRKPASLVFNSGFITNESTLHALGKHIPELVIFSDEKNHASIVHGIRSGRARCKVFAHNDMKALAALLAETPATTPKLVVVESVYSMDGTIAPLAQIAALTDAHGALLYVDEVHAVGMYGPTGAGVVEALGLEDRVDILQGTFGKAFGCIGGYIACSETLREFVIQRAPGLIFSTSLPVSLVASARASVAATRADGALRARLFEAVARMRAELGARGLPVMAGGSHILPVRVGDVAIATRLTAALLEDHAIFVQTIKSPSVKVGEERLRITPGPHHSDAQFDRFLGALDRAWSSFGLPRQAPVNP